MAYLFPLALLVIAVLPSFLGETHFAALGYSLLYQWTPERRKLDYYRFLAASDATAKEVKLFGLSRYLIDEYARLADDVSVNEPGGFRSLLNAFLPRKRGIGRNPRTGKEVRIPPGRTIRFKPGKELQNIGS